jgi:hypothetical protein
MSMGDLQSEIGPVEHEHIQPYLPQIHEDDLMLQQRATQIEEAKVSKPDLTAQKKSEKLDQESLNEINIHDGQSCSSQNNQMCRICFGENDSDDNPLISPCRCAGSMQHVHLKCLRQWLGMSENKKVSENVTTYTWKAFHCELCKEKLADHYEGTDQSHLIFEIQKPASNYVVIETSHVNQPGAHNKKFK